MFNKGIPMSYHFAWFYIEYGMDLQVVMKIFTRIDLPFSQRIVDRSHMM